MAGPPPSPTSDLPAERAAEPTTSTIPPPVTVLGVVVPTLATNAVPTATVGQPISDLALLQGGSNPTGTITFTLYGPGNSACSGPPAFTSTVTVAGNGEYSSGPFTPTAPGTYLWVAAYNGDAGNGPVTSACGHPDEITEVTVATPSLVTSATSATLGQPISDVATLSGGFNPTGSIGFLAYGPNDPTCGGDPVFEANVVVNGNGNYSSGSFTPLEAGQYHWVAEYSGDANNASASTRCGDPSEVSVVSPTTTTTSTTLPPTTTTTSTTLPPTTTTTSTTLPSTTTTTSTTLPPTTTTTSPLPPTTTTSTTVVTSPPTVPPGTPTTTTLPPTPPPAVSPTDVSPTAPPAGTPPLPSASPTETPPATPGPAPRVLRTARLAAATVLEELLAATEGSLAGQPPTLEAGPPLPDLPAVGPTPAAVGPGPVPARPPPARQAGNLPPDRSQFVESVTDPTDVSFDPVLIVQNLVLAALLILLIVFPAELFNSTVLENYEEIQGWPLMRDLTDVREFLTRVPSGPVLGAFAVSASVLYGLLSPDFGWNRTSLVLVLGMLVALTVVSAVYDVVRAAYMRRRFGYSSRLRAQAIGLAAGLLLVLASRLADFLPGYLYGVFTALVFARTPSDREDGEGLAFSSVLLGVVALVSWFAWVPVKDAATDPGAGLAILVLDAALACLWVAGLGAIVFGLAPIRFLYGEQVKRWSNGGWWAIYGVGMLAFVHTLLHPDRGFYGKSDEANLFEVIALFIAFGIFSVLFWGYFRYRHLWRRDDVTVG